MSNNKQMSVEKDFAPYEEALALKEIGFDEPCFGYWYTEQEDCKKVDVQISTVDFLGDEPDYILAPTFSQALRWFRERKLLGLVCPIDDWNSWSYSVQGEDCMSPFFQMVYGEEYKTYGEAELACLKKLIEIVKEGKNENI